MEGNFENREIVEPEFIFTMDPETESILNERGLEVKGDKIVKNLNGVEIPLTTISELSKGHTPARVRSIDEGEKLSVTYMVDGTSVSEVVDLNKLERKS